MIQIVKTATGSEYLLDWEKGYWTRSATTWNSGLEDKKLFGLLPGSTPPPCVGMPMDLIRYGVTGDKYNSIRMRTSVVVGIRNGNHSI